jgi:hypothetical protein
VFLTCTASRGWALIDRGLYLSMSWTDDWERCSEAGVASVDGEGNVEFVTTSKLVRRMLERLVAKHGKQVVGWFTGEEAYGDNPGRRADSVVISV